MKVKHAMILAAGLGTNKPITSKIPKPLIKIGSKYLLERSINLLENYGVEQIRQMFIILRKIESFISNLKSKKILPFQTKKISVDTGGGVKEGTKHFEKEPFCS